MSFSRIQRNHVEAVKATGRIAMTLSKACLGYVIAAIQYPQFKTMNIGNNLSTERHFFYENKYTFM